MALIDTVHPKNAGVVSPGSVAVPIIALGPLLLTASAITAPERFLALAPQVEAVQLAEPRVPGRNFTGQRGRWRCSRKCCHHSRRCGGGHDRQAVQIRPAFFVTLAVPKNGCGLAATAREEARTAQLAPVIHEMQCRDYSIHSIAVELGKRKVPTPRGGTWHPQLC